MTYWAIIFGVVFAFGALPAAAQVRIYDNNCQDARQKQHTDLIKRIGRLDETRHGALKREIKRSEKFTAEGEELNKRYSQAVTPIENRLIKDIRESRSYRKAREWAEQLAKKTDIRNQRQIRRFQEANRRSDEVLIKQFAVGRAKNPVIDEQRAGGVRFQGDSNKHEQFTLPLQWGADVGKLERQKIVAAAVEKFSSDAGYSPAQASQLKSRKAWSQAINALGVLRSFAGTGVINEDNAYGMQREFWESDAGKAVGAAQAAHEVGWMNVVYTTQMLGGSPAEAEARGHLGPKTRAAVAEFGAKGLSNIDRSIFVRARLKDELAGVGRLLPAGTGQGTPRPPGMVVPSPTQLMPPIVDAIDKAGANAAPPGGVIFVHD